MNGCVHRSSSFRREHPISHLFIAELLKVFVLEIMIELYFFYFVVLCKFNCASINQESTSNPSSTGPLRSSINYDSFGDYNLAMNDEEMEEDPKSYRVIGEDDLWVQWPGQELAVQRAGVTGLR